MQGDPSSLIDAVPSVGVLCSFLTALVLIPLLRRAAGRFTDAIPPIGGIAFVVSGVVALVCIEQMLPLRALGGLLAVFGIGVLDDLSALSPRRKTALLLIVLVATVLPDQSSLTGHPVLDKALHVLWLLWMCNAFNVLDAVDGLSAGVGGLILVTFGAVTLGLGLQTASVVCFVLAASLIAYLVYNFNPASVYMGDAGSLLIGFVSGEMAWIVASRVGGWIGISASLLVVSVVCFEAIFLILIRIAKVTMPSVSTYDHPTQRLIASGRSTKRAVLQVYLVTVALCGGGAACLFVSGQNVVMLVVVSAVYLVLTGIRLARVDTCGDGVDCRPGSVFSTNWLVNRIVHRTMHDVSGQVGGKMVDLGCGGRPYEQIFKEKVTDYFGLDLDSDRYRGQGIDAVSRSEVVGVASSSVDTVLSNQVIEHLSDPQAAVSEMARILKPGGTAIVTAPHIWGIHEEPHDYFRFTPYGLRHIAEQAGLTVKSVEPMAGYWVTAGTRFCYYLEHFERGPLKPIVRVAYYLIQSASLVLDHLHRVDGDAWNHLMIAVKEPVPGDTESNR